MSFVNSFLEPFITAVLLAGIYAAMSIGMTVIYGVMKIVNLAHAGFLMMGMYFAFTLFDKFHIDPVIGAALALPAFFLFGILVYLVLVRWLPKSDQPTLSSLLLMYGFWLVLQEVGYLIWGTEDRSIYTSYIFKRVPLGGPLSAPLVNVIVFAASVVSIVVLQIVLRKSWFGRSMRALIQNPLAAKIVGVDDRKTAMLTFGLGTAFAGFAGALLALLYSFSPDFGRQFLLRSFVIIVLGGLESFSGVAVGAFILALVETFSVKFVPASFQLAISYGLLVMGLMVLPLGKERWVKLFEYIAKLFRWEVLSKLFECYEFVVELVTGKLWSGLRENIVQLKELWARLLRYIVNLIHLPSRLVRARMNIASPRYLSLGVVFPVLLLLVLLFLPAAGLTENLTRLFFITLVWTITSVGWNIIGGFAGQVSFGFAVFYGLGAYTAALMINAGKNPVIALIASAGTAMLASFLIGLPTFRLRGPYFTIATIGVTEAVRVVMSNLEFTGGASGYRINESGPFRPLQHYYTALVVAALAVTISIAIVKSRFGLALRAIKQDQDAAADIGVKPYAFKLWAHAIAAALTGIAGGIYARYAIFIEPGSVFAFSTGVSILLMPVIGGIGTIWGPVLGAAVFGIVEEELVVYFPRVHLLLYGLLLILIILLEPDGLVGLFHRLVKLFRRRRDDSRGPGTDKVLWGRSRLEGREL